MGVSPHLPPISCIRPRTKGVCAFLGGVPPSHSGWSVTPPLSLAVPVCHALGAYAAWGVPLGRSWGLGVCPFLSCHALGTHADRGVPPPLPLLPLGSGGSPPPSQTFRAMGGHAAVGGGPPLHPGLAHATWARAVRPLPPPARARFARAAGAGGILPCLGPCCTGGTVMVQSAVPPIDLSACRGRAPLDGGSLPPSPLQRPLALGAGNRSGEPLVVVRPPSGSSALRARWESPSDSWSPSSRGGIPCCNAGEFRPVLRRAPWARAAGWGFTLPLPPQPVTRA